jgi:diguanylate cyclase (GGDEF)-like protein
VRITTSHDPVVARSQLSPAVALALVVVTLLVVFIVDRATTSAPVQHLYYLPIIIAGLRFGMRGGIIAALAAVALYHAANPHLLTFRYEESDLVQIALFLAVGTITAKLTHDRQRLRTLAMTDDLTGLHNLRSFEQRLIALVGESRQMRTSLALLVLDVDRLKSLNDEFGHLAGAEAVRTVGHLIGARMPSEAVACRYGGDEFVVAIPSCTPFMVHRIADDLRRAVQESAPVLAGRRFPAGTLSISIGASCASLEQHPVLPPSASRDVEVGETLFRAADTALYRAKASGRNQVCVVA